ncbi:MAG TPA: hypothetical protein VI248_17045 [Kineosporiaceae bacterium]
MTASFMPATPVVPRGGLVLLDPVTGAVRRVIALQYNPDSLKRTLQPQAVGGEQADRSEALRLRGPAHETYTLEVELDATDQLAAPGLPANVPVGENGLHPVLAVLDELVNPARAALLDQDAAARRGAFEIAPVEAPLTVLVWGRNRVVPVRVTDFSVTEEAFDSNLNPIRARLSLTLRVLTVDDVGFAHRGGRLFLSYLGRREQLAGLHPSDPLRSVGLTGPPGG